MARYALQFVDSIVSSPTVRLDLRSSPWVMRPGTDFGEPELKRSVAGGTPLRDGETYPTTAHSNRTITLALKINASSDDVTASALQTLERELARPTNILRYQPGTSKPIHFRTFRAAPGALIWDRVSKEIVVRIPAEPFALGLKETLASVSVFNNPANGTNGLYADITGIVGDVYTPLQIEWPVTGLISANAPKSVLAVARSVHASAPVVWAQAENMSIGTDGVLQPNDASMSGAGSNHVRVSFATATAMTQRVTTSVSGFARGVYRMFAAVRRSDSTSVIKMQGTYGTAPFYSPDGATTLPLSTARRIVDLGVVHLPAGADPVYDGASGTEMQVEEFFGAAAQRVSGTGTVDIDYLMLVRADDSLAVVSYPTAGVAANSVVRFDSPTERHFIRTFGGAVAGGATGVVRVAGAGAMYATPNATNRLWFLRTVDAATDDISTSTTLTISYWPRYAHVRPVSS